MAYVLGIDTSCDDTSVAVLNADTGAVLANVISSQLDRHAPHGGVVPELASRAHLENFNTVFTQALQSAGITVNDISAVAVTHMPGLIGCLLVGTSFAKGLAYQLNVPLYAVNHLHGHLFSPFIGHKIEYPFLGLVVSGGHTAFYAVRGPHEIELVGHTVDDAAGEAFDKTGKMMGLGYPGGPEIDKLARGANDKAFEFTVARVKMGPEYLSFSGLKTAAYDHVQKLGGSVPKEKLNDFCASVQRAIVDALCQKAEFFLKKDAYKAFALSGGVAMNSLLRQRMPALCANLGVPFFMAKPEHCTDNGAMIAHAGVLQKKVVGVFELETLPS